MEIGKRPHLRRNFASKALANANEDNDEGKVGNYGTYFKVKHLHKDALENSMSASVSFALQPHDFFVRAVLPATHEQRIAVPRPSAQYYQLAETFQASHRPSRVLCSGLGLGGLIAQSLDCTCLKFCVRGTDKSGEDYLHRVSGQAPDEMRSRKDLGFHENNFVTALKDAAAHDTPFDLAFINGEALRTWRSELDAAPVLKSIETHSPQTRVIFFYNTDAQAAVRAFERGFVAMTRYALMDQMLFDRLIEVAYGGPVASHERLLVDAPELSAAAAVQRWCDDSKVRRRLLSNSSQCESRVRLL